MKIKDNIAISDSGFVFDPSTGESFTFNPTGLEIFRLLKDRKSYPEIVEIVTDKYDIEESDFERFYYDFVSTLKQYQLTDHENE